MLNWLKRNGKIVFLLFGIAIVAIIFHFSNQDAIRSYGITYRIVDAIIPRPISQADWDRRSMLITLVRKMAHIFLYAWLGANVSLLSWNNTRLIKSVSISGLICVCIAVIDEIHQISIDGRGASVLDVIIDVIGICIGIAIVMIAQKNRGKR